MTRLGWGTVGERYFEAGADRGVLYPKNENGVPWNGLISVSESPTGGEAQPYYIDGFKYLNISSAEEFEATIEAFSSPAEFDRCDGTVSIHTGLFITQQPRESFNLSYRTQIGNDVDGLDHGYKLHLVYNALSTPASKSNVTMSDSTEPMVLSWGISTRPPFVTGYKPTSHFVIDSRLTSALVLSAVENVLYGTSSTNPRMPTPEELLDIFQNTAPVDPGDVLMEFSTDPDGTPVVIIDDSSTLAYFDTDPDGTPVIVIEDEAVGANFTTDPDGTPVIEIG